MFKQGMKTVIIRRGDNTVMVVLKLISILLQYDLSRIVELFSFHRENTSKNKIKKKPQIDADVEEMLNSTAFHNSFVSSLRSDCNNF